MPYLRRFASTGSSRIPLSQETKRRTKAVSASIAADHTLQKGEPYHLLVIKNKKKKESSLVFPLEMKQSARTEDPAISYQLLMCPKSHKTARTTKHGLLPGARTRYTT